MDDGSLTATSQFITDARKGDEQARTALVLRYREPLSRFLHARLARSARGVQDTSDIVQEALSAAILQLDRFEYQGLGSFWSYLRRIGLNLVGQTARRRQLPMAQPRDPTASGHDHAAREAPPAAAMQQAERLEAVEAALQRLPTRARESLLLRLELDLPYETIAHECDYPSASAARMAITRTLADLAQRLARFEP